MAKKDQVTSPRPSNSTHENEEVNPEGSYSLFNIWVITLVLKLLVSIGYKSTDFEVHRNWLAITYHLPLKQWYTDTTSEWTLDYPPFFAYFEWVLSHLTPRPVIEDGCLDLVEKGKYGMLTVFYQRFTVIASEVVLFLALQWYVDSSRGYTDKRRAFVVACSLVLSPGLLIIDHIHFQYNGFLFGLLVLMINNARLENHLMVGFWFSVLLCFKHIFLYLAPAVFVYLLFGYCLNTELLYAGKISHRVIRWKNSFRLAFTVIAVFTVAFGPFVWYGVMPQLLARLFPFSRGLTHAYWAPNIWAIYSAVDRVCLQIYFRIPVSRSIFQYIFQFDPSNLLNKETLKSSTRGLVGDSEYLILPEIKPQLTFFLALFYQIMALIPLILQPTFRRFVGSLTLCAYASFLFGWHVHEKAILLVIFPISFLVSRDLELLDSFNLLVSSGYMSLFPLLFTCEEWLVKVMFAFLWYVIFYFNFRKVTRIPKSIGGQGRLSLGRMINSYILGLATILLCTSIMDLYTHKFAFLKKLEFLKLMIISTYCGVGVISSWNIFSWYYFMNESIWASD